MIAYPCSASTGEGTAPLGTSHGRGQGGSRGVSWERCLPGPDRQRHCARRHVRLAARRHRPRATRSCRGAREGWVGAARRGTRLDRAAHHPEQAPQTYGCRTWPQVLSASRCLRLEYRDDMVVQSYVSKGRSVDISHVGRHQLLSVQQYLKLTCPRRAKRRTKLRMKRKPELRQSQPACI
jgi:hypothetical protein